MAIETRILKGSNNLSQGGMFEPHTNDIELLIRDCSAEPTLQGAFQVQEFLADPGQGDIFALVGSSFKYNDGSNWVDYLPPTEFGAWRVRNIRVMSHPSEKNTWKVTISQTNMGRLYKGGTTNLYGVTSLTINLVNRSRTVQAWRAGGVIWDEKVGASFDAGGANGAGALYENCPEDWKFCDSDRDIGGFPIDINGGNPTNLNVGQEQITIEFIARSPYVDEFGNNTVTNNQWPLIYELQNLMNSRNAEEWFGYEPGYLLVSDISIQPLHHEFKRVTLTLLYDKWKHANQRPWVTSAGVVANTNDCSSETEPTGIEIVNLTASYVGWLQPWQLMGSLGSSPADLFPSNVWNDIWIKFTGTDGSSYAAATSETCDG